VRKVDINYFRCREGIKEKMYKGGIPTSRGVREEVRNIQVGKRRERGMRGRFKTFNIRNPRFFPNLQIQTRADHLTITLLNKRHTFKDTFP
jgi:hypothetical protein